MNKVRTINSIRISVVFTATIAIFIPLLFTYAAGSNPLPNPLNVSSFGELIDSVLKIVMAIGTPIAILAIVYSGFLFVTAQGSEDKLKTAKSALLWSIVGTTVLLGAWVLAGAISSTIEALKG